MENFKELQVEENIFINGPQLANSPDGKTNWINQLTWIRSYENDPVVTKDWQEM